MQFVNPQTWVYCGGISFGCILPNTVQCSTAQAVATASGGGWTGIGFVGPDFEIASLAQGMAGATPLVLPSGNGCFVVGWRPGLDDTIGALVASIANGNGGQNTGVLPQMGQASFILNPLATASTSATVAIASVAGAGSLVFGSGAAASFAAGMGVQIGSGATMEYRIVYAVVGGTTVYFDGPGLTFPHSIGENVQCGAAVVMGLVSKASIAGAAVQAATSRIAYLLGAPIGDTQGRCVSVSYVVPVNYYVNPFLANATAQSLIYTPSGP